MMLAGAGGGGSMGDDSSSPYTSWTDLRNEGFTNIDKWLQLAGYTYKIRIDDQGFAKFTLNNNTYTRVYWGNSINGMCGSAQAKCNDLNTYTVGTTPAPLWHANSSPYNTWVNWDWADAEGTVVNHAFFNTFAGQMSTGYRSNSWWMGQNDVETGNCWHFKYSDGHTTQHDRTADHSSLTIMADDWSNTFQNSWLRNDKILTAFYPSYGDDPAGSIHTWRHGGNCKATWLPCLPTSLSSVVIQC